MRRHIVFALLMFAACEEKAPDCYPAGAVQQTREAIARAKTVVVYEVANQYDEDYAQFRGRPRLLLQYPVRRKITVPRAVAEPVLTKLTTRETYMQDDRWSCIFEPHHVIVLPSMTLVVCVKCGDVEFYVDNKRIADASILRGREVKEMFDALFQ